MASSPQVHPYKKHLMQSQHINFETVGPCYQNLYAVIALNASYMDVPAVNLPFFILLFW